MPGVNTEEASKVKEEILIGFIFIIYYRIYNLLACVYVFIYIYSLFACFIILSTRKRGENRVLELLSVSLLF